MSGNVHAKARGRDAMCSDGANPAAAIYTANGRERVKQECLRAESKRPKVAESAARANIFMPTREGRIKARHSYVHGMAFADARPCPAEGNPET
jgi:hypothetical protein